MKYSSTVVGNSSSGLIEAPVLNGPVINKGNRQKSNTQSHYTISCENNKTQISAAFTKLESIKITNK